MFQFVEKWSKNSEFPSLHQSSCVVELEGYYILLTNRTLGRGKDPQRIIHRRSAPGAYNTSYRN